MAPASARDAYEGEDEDAEDDDGGRTIVRPEGGAKSVRRSSPQSSQSSPPPRSTPSANPTSISPAAVIRKTMESQRATRGLVSGPPPELRGDLDHQENDEFTQTAAPRMSNRSGAHRSNYPPPASYEGPPSHRPPQRGTERLDFTNDDFRRDATAAPGARNRFDSGDDYSSSRNQPPPSGPISGHPMSGPRSAPPVSQPPPSSVRPGHFANPAPSSYSAPPNGVNPHGPTHAMPAVGYGAMPNGSVPPPAASNAAMPAHFRMAQTGAVAGVMADPPGTSVTSNTRVSGRPAMSWAAALAACGVFVGVVAVAIAQRGDAMTDTQAALVDPAHTAKTPATQPVETTPPANPLPPGLIGASPVQPQTAPTAPAIAPAVAPMNGMSDPNLGIAPPAQPTAAQPAAATTGDKVAKAPKASFAPARAAAPARPARAAAAADDDEEKPAKKPAKAGKGDADEETRRALEELRKAQLEQSLGK